MRFVEKVTVEQIYSSVLKARRVRNEAGWERMEPVVVAENPTASPVMNAIARAMRERLFTSERELANYLEADLSPEWEYAIFWWPIVPGVGRSCWPARDWRSARWLVRVAIRCRTISLVSSRSNIR